MKNFVNTKFVIAIMMIVSVMMVTSCQQDDELLTPVMEEKVNNSNVVARSGYNSLYDFDENQYNSSKSSVGGDVRSPGYVYKWKITDYSSTGTLLNPKLEFICPDGVTRYIAMTKVVGPGNVWILNQSLSQNGRYTWRYVANNGSALTSWNSYVDNIKITNPTSDDYFYKNQTSGDCTADKWKMCMHNCTSYVAWKVNQMWGTDTAFWNKMVDGTDANRLGHAKDWKSKLAMRGYQSNNTPIVGSIAYWSGYPANSTFGHVAFVCKVYDNGAIDIQEYNYSYHAYNKRTIQPGALWYPQSFIHVQHRR